MAFDSSSNEQARRRSSGPNLPEVSRPRTDIWNSLRADGIQWEGQVLLVGSGAGIPALLVLTEQRFVLFSGGEIALEVPKPWLRPEPRLLAENGVRILMTPQGGGSRADETDRLTIRVREGRGAAAKLVSTISGRLVTTRVDPGVRTSSPDPGWGSTIGAGAAVALPPLPDFDEEPVSSRATRSWPPVEQHGIPGSSPEARAHSRGTGHTSISSWTAANLDPAPDSIPASRPARSTTAKRSAATHEVVPVVEEHHPFNRGLVWGLRSLILALVVGTGLYFGRDSLPANLQLPAEIEQRLGLNQEKPNTNISQVPASNQQAGSDVVDTETPEPTKPSSDGTNGPRNSDSIGTNATDENGTGGIDGVLTPVNPGIGEYAEPTEEPQAQAPVTEAVTEPEVEATEPPVIETEPLVTEEPATQEPVTEELVTQDPVTEEPTEVPTEIPVTEVPATEVPATEAPATEVPATEAPTEIPGRQDPTESASTEVPATEEPVAPVATLESQPASVDSGATPEQSLANGAFRFTITGASRGETVSELPDLQATGTGEWVVLSLFGENWSDTEQVFDMTQFRLYADGQEVLLDVGNAWIGGLLNHTPAYGNTDAILWAGDEGHEFALTFLAPQGAQQLTLVAGDQEIDLSPALAEPQPLAQDTNAPTQPEYLEGKVVEVVSADEIVIEKDGIQQTVRYLGLDVPTGDDCFADDATEVNRKLVEGKTIRLERQSTDVDARGNWVRDVWAPAKDGRYFLVSEALVSEGAATVGISDPNTRYEGWLLGSQSAAKAEERGLWGACGDDSAELPSQPEAMVPATNGVTARRTRATV